MEWYRSIWREIRRTALLSAVVRAFLLAVLVILLAGCGCTTEPAPIYPDASVSTSPISEVSLHTLGPHFGDKLQKASGNYSLATGSLDAVQQWYDRQVAESSLIYVAEQREPGALYRLIVDSLQMA